MYLWILGYNIGNSGAARIGVDGDIGPKTLTSLSNEFPNQDITNLSEIRKQLKERAAPVMLKRGVKLDQCSTGSPMTREQVYERKKEINEENKKNGKKISYGYTETRASTLAV